MNNLLSYSGLTDSRMRASEKDLPVTQYMIAVLGCFFLKKLKIMICLCCELVFLGEFDEKSLHIVG